MRRIGLAFVLMSLGISCYADLPKFTLYNEIIPRPNDGSTGSYSSKHINDSGDILVETFRYVGNQLQLDYYRWNGLTHTHLLTTPGLGWNAQLNNQNQLLIGNYFYDNGTTTLIQGQNCKLADHGTVLVPQSDYVSIYEASTHTKTQIAGLLSQPASSISLSGVVAISDLRYGISRWTKESGLQKLVLPSGLVVRMNIPVYVSNDGTIGAPLAKVDASTGATTPQPVIFVGGTGVLLPIGDATSGEVTSVASKDLVYGNLKTVNASDGSTNQIRVAWVKGVLHKLELVGNTSFGAVAACNSSGSLVGWLPGQNAAFRMTPVPEPSTLFVTLAGFCGVLCRRRKRTPRL